MSMVSCDVAEVHIAKRHVRAMCSQSEGVRHLDRERVQAPRLYCHIPVEWAGSCFTREGTWVGRGYNVSCACSVRSCTDPVASVSCRSRLRTYHGSLLSLGPMKAPKSRGDGKGGWLTCRFRGPSLATKGVLGGTPYTSWFMVPRLVRRPVHVPWPKFFFFLFLSLTCTALYCTTTGLEGKVTCILEDLQRLC